MKELNLRTRWALLACFGVLHCGFLQVGRGTAEEFPYFSVTFPGQQRPVEMNGYVQEDSAHVKKIRVLPIFHEISSLLDKDGSVTVSYGLKPFDANFSSALRQRVAQAIPGVGPRDIVDGIPARDMEVALFIGAEQVASSPSNKGETVMTFGRVPGFTIPAQDAKRVAAIMAGHYSVCAVYKAPLDTFSRLKVELEKADMSGAYASAFQDMASKMQKKGVRILFADWRKTVASTSTQVKARSNSENQSKLSLNITVVDQGPETLQRLDRYLGIADLSQEECLKRHQASCDAAEAKGDSAFAKANKDYIEAIKVGEPKLETRALKAVAALKKGNILSFLSDGIAFSSAEGSANVHFASTSTASSTSLVNKDVSELFLKSGFVEIRQYGTPSPTHFKATLTQLRRTFPSLFSDSPPVDFTGFAPRREPSLRDFVYVETLKGNMDGFISHARNDVRFAWIGSSLPGFQRDNESLDLGWATFTPAEVKKRFGTAFYRYWIAALGVEGGDSDSDVAN